MDTPTEVLEPVPKQGLESPVIKAVNLTKRFGSSRRNILAVDNLSIEVKRGSIYGFLGPNGSGKTTTIGLLLGLIRPTSGSIELFGTDTRADLPALLRRTSALLENAPFYPYLSGRDNLEAICRTAEGFESCKIDEALETVGLARRARSKAKTYSLGMRQRLAIAACLVRDPELIILDEPTNGLDPSGIIEIRELISDLGKQGKTIFLSSHLLHEVEQVCDHLAVLNRGRVIAQGSADELLRRGKMVQFGVSDVEKAVSLLESEDWITTIETQEGNLFLEIADENIPVVNRMLVEAGIRVSEITRATESLEDFFLEKIEEQSETGI